MFQSLEKASEGHSKRLIEAHLTDLRFRVGDICHYVHTDWLEHSKSLGSIFLHKNIIFIYKNGHVSTRFIYHHWEHLIFLLGVFPLSFATSISEIFETAIDYFHNIGLSKLLIICNYF